MFDYDVLILGGGLAYAGAEFIRNSGLKVAIVERDMAHLGGVCLHEGCIPTKLYLFEARKLYDLRCSPLLSAETLKLNLKNLKDKKQKLTKFLRNQIENMLKGVDLIQGYGELVEPHVVDVEGKRISAKNLILNTGKNYPESPNGNHLLELEELPQSLKLLGDDLLLLEFACMFALMGVKVEVFFEEASLELFHPSIKNRLIKSLKETGVVFSPADAPVEGAYYLRRRVPNSACIKVDVAKDELGHVVVDRNYETSLKNHYAVGDLNGIYETAHASRLQALSVAKRIVRGEGFYTPAYKVPYVLYTQPLSYARIGLSRKELEKRGMEFTEKGVSFRAFAVGSIYHTEEGMAFLYFDRKGFFIGAEVLSRDAGEIASALTVSLFSELNLDMLSKVCLPHPTLAEVPFMRL
ncbi:MAG: FAD-dependent oxidoreductase [Aquificaceae bacterium]|nr:FAD-dependent oxidoreductase [Aquificaceae bacterium]MCS7196691.1 FAD-dependent oxidoreductase [Aquificaceae bacterium]MCX8076646.1 FAD-dependent oxidoreductase [Aquificaceae bacterium]MDW8294547.1 FAD-dependent oxidoreductase [Aquificaceae bacterium]